jgi:hypothetical protein
MGPRRTRAGVRLGLAVTLLGACGTAASSNQEAGRAARALREQRAQVRDLLVDVARAALASQQGDAQVELRGTYAGCASDAVGQGYRSWTYAGGGRIAGPATLDDAEQVLAGLGVGDVSRHPREVRGRRRGVEVAVTRHRGALVVTARARPCTEVPTEQQESWLDREDASRIPLEQRP